MFWLLGHYFNKLITSYAWRFNQLYVKLWLKPNKKKEQKYDSFCNANMFRIYGSIFITDIKALAY